MWLIGSFVLYFNKMVLLILFLPLIGCGAAGLFGRVLGGRGAGLLTTGLLFLSFVLFCIF